MIKRAKIFRDFLQENQFYIDYNGEHYTLVKDSDVKHVTNTADEMYNFIMGFNLAKSMSDETILNLTEINRTNVERYEKIIENYTDETD